jgi:hypothetical protein
LFEHCVQGGLTRNVLIVIEHQYRGSFHASVELAEIVTRECRKIGEVLGCKWGRGAFLDEVSRARDR